MAKKASVGGTRIRPVAKKASVGGTRIPPAKKPAKAKAKARAPAKSTADTPVTLEQAQALARVQQPRRAAVQAVTPPPTPATVGLARKELEARRRADRERQIREYTATMKIMKSRGARRRTTGGAGRRGGAAKASSFKPLQVMAEGDSWFNYPYPGYGGGIVKRLQKRLGVPILDLAEAGDEVRFMLGVEQRARLVKALNDGCPAGGPWDVVLFSGGGNDIVDDPMALWVKDWNANTAPADHLHQARFDNALALVRAGYEDLIALRDKLSPGTHLVFHGYDFAIPDGRGACHLGPWMKPTFDMRGFPSLAARSAVVRRMLEQFAAMLDTLPTLSPLGKVTVIKTQGTLAPKPAAWHNELHPAKAGFDTFAARFQQELKKLFPDRVE